MSTIPMSRFWAVLFLIVGIAPSSVYCQTASTQRGVQEATSTSSSSPSPIGPYYALIIGNNDYKELNKLQTAVGDAKALDQLLRERFGFETKTLYNATRADILRALDDYQIWLPEKSNLLIYYAGHGHKDVAARRAYWLPVDAQRDHSPNWINSVEITDKLRAIPARHILVIADSCWSGDLAMRSGGAAISSVEHNAVLIRSLNLKSRHIMSSGGDEPVADGGGGSHSVFTGALLQSLKDMNADSFTAEALLVQRIQPRVAGRSQQTPEYLILRESDNDLGDFVFFRSKDANGTVLSARSDSPESRDQSPDELVDPADKHAPLSSGDAEKPFLMPIEDIFLISGRGTAVTGRIERGKIKTGEEVEIVGLRATRKAVVLGVEMNGKLSDEGTAGDNVGLLLRGIAKGDVERGMVLARGGSIRPHTKFKAEIHVLTKEEGGQNASFYNGYRPHFYFRTTSVTGVVDLPAGVEKVTPGSSVSLTIELVTPVALEKGLTFAIRERDRTVGTGIISEIIQ